MACAAPIPRPDPVFLGYIFKQIKPGPMSWCQHPDGTPAAESVQRICSVSSCISEEPDTKYDRWAFNAAGCYEHPDPALASIAPDSVRAFTTLGLGLFPILFEDSGLHELAVDRFFGETINTISPPANLVPLGYDVVSCSPAEPATHTTGGVIARFGCSPLSCNGEAANYSVNANCLLDSWEEAVAAAIDFAQEEPEPGPYVIVRIYTLAGDKDEKDRV